MAFGDAVLAEGRRWLGTTYAWGGGDNSGPTRGIRDGGTADRYGDYNKVGFDCSGLVKRCVFVASGGTISLPHLADSQSRMGQPISQGQLGVGDIIGFSSNGGGRYHHIGIYAGGGQLLNAPQSGDVVRISPLSNWGGETMAFRRFGAVGTGAGGGGSSGAQLPARSTPGKLNSSGRTDGTMTGTSSDGLSTPSPAVQEEEPLPAIGPAAKHAVIPLRRLPYVDADWNRLAEVRVNGAGMTGDLVTAVQAVSMSYSASQIGQFSLTLADPDGDIIASGILEPGAAIDFGDQHLEIRGLDIRPGSGGPQLTVKARSRVVSILRGPEHIGRGTWGEQDTTRWVLDRCEEAGAIPVVQGGLGSQLFERQGDEETTWDTLQRAAKTAGVWCYEFEQIVTFMRPSELANRGRARWWDLVWLSSTDYTNGMVGLPSYSWSMDGTAESLSFELASADAILARPGDGVTLFGNLGGAVGDWIVTQVDDPVSTAKAVGITCSRILDPQPETEAVV